MLGKLLQHQREVAGPDDQNVIEAFAAQGADPALYDRVRLRLWVPETRRTPADLVSPPTEARRAYRGVPSQVQDRPPARVGFQKSA